MSQQTAQRLSLGEQEELVDAIKTIVEFAARSKREYEATKEWTAKSHGSCMTIRVPTALLNRIRDLGDYVCELRAQGVAI